MSDYDAIVIGAGNGGLTAAATLAKNGLNALLLERHNIPGGAATSFVRGRFEFEVALHQLSGIGTIEKPGPLRMLLDDLGVTDKIDFVPMSDLYRVVVPDRADITLAPDKEAIVTELSRHFPKEAGGIKAFFDLTWQVFTDVIGAFMFKDPEVSKEKYPHYFKYALKTYADVVDAHIQDPLLKAVISPYWTYLGLPPSRLNFVDMAATLFVYSEFLPVHIKGGSQALSNALADTILDHGGSIRFNCGVKRIIVADGRVKGVVTDDGEEIRTDYVISNASKVTTYVDMIGGNKVPARITEELKRSSVSQSAFTIYLGFDCPPEEIGLTASTNFLLGSLDSDEVYRRMKVRDIDERDGFLFTCYDAIDDSFSPPGCCQAALITLKYGDDWLSVPPDEYAKEKFRIADDMLKVAEKSHPGLREHIEEMEIATPLTHMRYLGHPKGAIYGFDPLPAVSPLFMPNRSQIEGLYNTGGWYGASGFQPTLESGTKAARALIKAFAQAKEASK